jgi:hypothetical protein
VSNLYRKKPVVIQAMQWTGENVAEIWDWVGDERVSLVGSQYSDELVIRTLEDGRDNQVDHVASVGDWIIRGVTGEIYPCKPDIFAATYDKVEDEK